MNNKYAKKITVSIVMIILLVVVTSCKKKNPDMPDIAKFMMAIQNNDLDTMKYYLKNFNYMAVALIGTGPMGIGGVHMDPMMVAAAFNHQGTEVFDLLFKYGGHLDYVNEVGTNALYAAALKNNVAAIEYLIDKGMDVNFTDTDGGSCLVAALSLKSFDAVKVLLEHGAKISVLTNEKSNLYHLIPALDVDIQTKKELLSLCLQYEPELFESSVPTGETSFATAILYECYDLIDFYLAHGASAVTVLNCNHPNIDYLFMPENIKHLKTLLHNVEGKVLNGADKEGFTLLIKAINYNIDNEIIKEIAEKSENIDVKTPDNTTALMYAVISGNLEIIKMLIEKGADVHNKDRQGVEPMKYHEYVQEKKGEPINPEIAALLK